MRTLLLSFLYYISGLTLLAQSPVSHFKAEEINENVYLTWTIQQGFTCNGVDILHSLDSVNFTKIGDIEGICGSSATEINYSFTDLFPEKNKLNYYRLSLGGLAYSNIISIRVIDIPANNYLVVPNPVINQSLIYFENSAFATCRLIVYSTLGQIVFEELITEETFLLQKEVLPDGPYSFKIIYDNGKEPISGKFVSY